MIRLANQRYLELPTLYKTFTERLNGSILIVPKKMNEWYYPDSKEVKTKMIKLLEKNNLLSSINRIYVVLGCMRDSIFFRTNAIVMHVNDKIYFDDLDLSTRFGKGNIIIAFQLSRNSYIDLPKALSNIRGNIAFNVEETYEMLSLLNIYAVAAKYGLSIGVGDVLGEVMILLSKVMDCGIDKNTIDDLYRKILIAKDAVQQYSYTIGSYGVLRVGEDAKLAWRQKFGGIPGRIKHMFTLSDPLFRSRTSIYGFLAEGKIENLMNCVLIVGITAESISKDQLLSLESLSKDIFDYLSNYVSQFLELKERILLRTPKNGVLTLYMARR